MFNKYLFLNDCLIFEHLDKCKVLYPKYWGITNLSDLILSHIKSDRLCDHWVISVCNGGWKIAMPEDRIGRKEKLWLNW